MKLKDEIYSWIRNNCDLTVAIDLFEKYGNNFHFLRLCKMQPEENRKMLEYQLCQLAGISEKEFKEIKRINNNNPVSALKIGKSESKEVKKFRDEFPFLKEVDCPPELKILAADKITAYTNYLNAYNKLYDSSSIEDCKNNASEVLNNFKENRSIYKELEYYKKKGVVLGKHKIFKHYKKLKTYDNQSLTELTKLAIKTLPGRMWRIQNEISKNDKPHLNTERQERLKRTQEELVYIKRLLNIEE